MIGVTKRQSALLRFIAGFQAAHGGVSPSVRQCARAMGVKGPASIQWLLDALERRGQIRRLQHRHRAIEVLVPVTVPMVGDVPLYAVPMVARQQLQAFSGERI